MSAKKKHRKSRPLTPHPAAVIPARSQRWRLLLISLAVVVCLATWGFFELVVWNRLPAGLVGTWEVVNGPPEYRNAVFDFYRNGTMVGKVNLKGDVGIIKADVRVEGDKIYSKSKHPQTGQERTQVQIIRTLTATELVVEDENGIVMEFKRPQ